MFKVEFYDLNTVEDKELKYSVISAKYQNRWVFVKHKQRDTWEAPGGKKRQDEDIDTCARRELIEETGANKFILTPLCIYSVSKDGVRDFAQLYYAEIESFNELPDFEIEKVEFFDDLPNNLTYPQIESDIFRKTLEMLKQKF